MSSPINFKRLSPSERRAVERGLCWARNASGTVTVHLLQVHDYRGCEIDGGMPVTYIKRLSGRHPRRYRGRQVSFFPDFTQMPANVWHEVVGGVMP